MTMTIQPNWTVESAMFGRLYAMRIAGNVVPASVARPSNVYLGGPRADGEYWFILLPVAGDDGTERGWPLNTSGETPLPVRQAYNGRRGWWVVAADVREVLDEVSVPDAPTVAATRSALAEAERSLHAVEAEFEEFKETVQRIGLVYAERHSWCEAYDRMMEEIGLPGRTRTYSVEVTAQVTFTVNVEANTEEDAESQVAEASRRTYVTVPNVFDDLIPNEDTVYGYDRVEVTVNSVDVVD